MAKIAKELPEIFKKFNFLIVSNLVTYFTQFAPNMVANIRLSKLLNLKLDCTEINLKIGCASTYF